jgi:lipoyl(octanoyl) transferase
MKLNVIKLGLIEYKEALELQFKIQKLVQLNELEHTMLLLEHPPVITIGVNGRKNNNILADKDFLKSQGVDVFESDRGGDVTYHGPGQIVGYPILNLNYLGKDVKDYARKLEAIFIEIMDKEYGINVHINPGFPGVWVGNDKITAIGCSVKRWVTMHGFAFNVNTNLDHFRWINPCGFTDRGVTSLQKLLGLPQDIKSIEDIIIKYSAELFNLDTELSTLQKLNLFSSTI